MRGFCCFSALATGGGAASIGRRISEGGELISPFVPHAALPGHSLNVWRNLIVLLEIIRVPYFPAKRGPEYCILSRLTYST